MAGIFVRGLTGNKVNVFVDGVATRPARSAAASARSGSHRSGRARFGRSVRGPNSAAVRERRARRQPPVPVAHAVISPAMARRRRRSVWRARQQRRRAASASSVGSYAGPRFGADLRVAGRRIGDAPAGRRHRFPCGRHAVSRRAVDVADAERLPDTGFNQYGGRCVELAAGANDSRRRLAISAAQPGRRQALRSVARRRRQPDRRPARSDARPRSTRATSGSAPAGSTTSASPTR